MTGQHDKLFQHLFYTFYEVVEVGAIEPEPLEVPDDWKLAGCDKSPNGSWTEVEVLSGLFCAKQPRLHWCEIDLFWHM